ncbi:MAG: hypothetical protein V1754_11115 [Pseudomonadota bacterium]
MLIGTRLEKGFCCRWFVFFTVLTVMGVAPGRALAQSSSDPTVVQIQQKNKEAIEAFESYSFKKGEFKLEQAIQLAAAANLSKHAILAETYILLGVAAIGGKNDLYRGLYNFVRALRIYNGVQLPNNLVTPQIRQVFVDAEKKIKAIGTPSTIEVSAPQEEKKAETLEIAKTVRGLVHDVVDEAKRGYPIPIKAAAGVDLRVNRMFLYFRAAGKVEYERLRMSQVGGLFRGAIPAGITVGNYVHYYVEARDPRGRLAASHGSARGPNVIIVR